MWSQQNLEKCFALWRAFREVAVDSIETRCGFLSDQNVDHRSSRDRDLQGTGLQSPPENAFSAGAEVPGVKVAADVERVESESGVE
jgi:hypothetical protein